MNNVEFFLIISILIFPSYYYFKHRAIKNKKLEVQKEYEEYRESIRKRREELYKNG